MTKKLVRAFLDSESTINVEIDKVFCQGKSEYFHLLLNQDIVQLQLNEINECGDYYTYKLTCPSLIIGQPYEVMVVNAYRTPLVYRYIVKTDWFNEHYYYTQADLGANVVNGNTVFKVWAPTASLVSVYINSHSYPMKREEKGVHVLAFKGDLSNVQYNYLVNVNGEVALCLDPYGKASSVNSKTSVATNDLPNTKTTLETRNLNDEIIYELNVSDYTAEGTFNALTQEINYLSDLGITTVQLLPVNDFATVDELHKEIYHNWGYDPVQYQCLEGSFSSEVKSPIQVKQDFKALVNSFHSHKIKVVLDVVFNHVYDVNSCCLNKLVPYYYFRYEGDQLANGSFCGNEIASEMPMTRKYFLDTLKYFIKHYDVDGFRFDLMGLLDYKTINTFEEELKKVKPNIMLYGEGWNMKAAISYELLANMTNSDKLGKIAFFNDEFREIIKGSIFDDKHKGYGAGNLDLVTKAIEAMKSFRFSDPAKSINYVECHDDLTLYDKLKVACDEDEQKLISRVKLINACVVLSQGISFIANGQEFAFSKNGIHNSYNISNKLTPQAKQAHQDVINYTKALIRLKKLIYKTGYKDSFYFDKDGVIIIHVNNYEIIINPKDTIFHYTFFDQKCLLLNEKEELNQTINDYYDVQPISVAVIGSDMHDQPNMG